MTEDQTPPPRKRRQPRKRKQATEPAASTPAKTDGDGEAPVAAEDQPSPARTPPTPTEPVVGSEPAAGASHEPAPLETHTAPMVITIFGGTGFIGKRLVAHLVERGARVKVATRGDGRGVVAEGPGSVETVNASLDDDGSVRAALAGATAVVNLVGILHESGGQTFESVHVEGARRVAAAANALGVTRFVHMSALGASAKSPSVYARTKALGEQAVHERHPDASVIRPSIVFGPEDGFFNRFAAMAKMSPALPLIGGGMTRFQPVYVEDVAAAIVCILETDEARGKTYELGGPRAYTFKELMELMLKVKGASRVLVPIPFFLAEIQGSVLQMLPTPPLTRDQVELLKTDNVVGGSAPGLEALGITPTPLEEVLPSYL